MKRAFINRIQAYTYTLIGQECYDQHVTAICSIAIQNEYGQLEILNTLTKEFPWTELNEAEDWALRSSFQFAFDDAALRWGCVAEAA